MRKSLFAAVLGGALALAGPVAAQTSLTETLFFTPEVRVNYRPFTVTQAGTFEFYTHNNWVDPYLRLFTGFASQGPDLGTQIAANDDWNGLQSYINIFLNPGSYTLAASHYHFDESEARSGYNGSGPSEYQFDVTRQSTDALVAATATPEPVSMALLGTGLAGLGAARRRRRKEAEPAA